MNLEFMESFLSTKKLVNDFVHGKVSSTQRFYYFAMVPFCFALDEMGTIITHGYARDRTPLEIAVLFLVQVAAIGFCFKINREVDDRNFIDRFISFSVANWPKAYLISYLYIRFGLPFLDADIVKGIPPLEIRSASEIGRYTFSMSGILFRVVPPYFFLFFFVIKNFITLKNFQNRPGGLIL